VLELAHFGAFWCVIINITDLLLHSHMTNTRKYNKTANILSCRQNHRLM